MYLDKSFQTLAILETGFAARQRIQEVQFKDVSITI